VLSTTAQVGKFRYLYLVWKHRKSSELSFVVDIPIVSDALYYALLLRPLNFYTLFYVDLAERAAAQIFALSLLSGYLF
jgi:hypothetical protein